MKIIKIFMVIMTFIISFPIHFIYELYPSYITSILFPVNESIWEHMKIFYTAIVISSVVEYFLYKLFRIKTNNFIINIPLTSIFCIVIYLIIYSIINLFISHNFIITIMLMLFVYFLGDILSYYLLNMKEIPNQKELGICLILLSYIIFTHLTYYPLNIDLFIDPITNKCGL